MATSKKVATASPKADVTPRNCRHAARLKLAKERGVTPEKAAEWIAKRVLIGVPYYKRLESKGGVPVSLAYELARVMDCEVKYWLYYR